MTKRYIYYIDKNNQYHKESISFKWFPGFAKSQYQKSSESLIKNFHNLYPNYRVLEVSSASSSRIGVAASAFNLKMKINNQVYTVEQLFQAGKVFENNGSQEQLLNYSSQYAKKEIRKIRTDDKLIGFRLFGKNFNLEPKTLFYNWLYINALAQPYNNKISSSIISYDAFSDIHFNPKSSINTQAEGCAFYVKLKRTNKLDEALKSIENFKKTLYSSNNNPIKEMSLF